MKAFQLFHFSPINRELRCLILPLQIKIKILSCLSFDCSLQLLNVAVSNIYEKCEIRVQLKDTHSNKNLDVQGLDARNVACE